MHNEICTGGGTVCAFLCVSGDARDTVHSSGIRGLMKKKKQTKKTPEMFGYGPTEIERRRRDPDESAIPNSHLGFER